MACPYASVGCSDKIPRKDLQHHVQSQTQKHLQIINDRLAKVVQLQSTSIALNDVSACDDDIAGNSDSTNTGLTRTYSGTALQSTQKLMKELFQRVVQLEQKNCQMEINQRKMEKELQDLKSEK